MVDQKDIIDGSTLLIEDTPYGRKTMHFDRSEGTFHIKNEKDVGPLLNLNKRLMNEHSGYCKSEWRYVADIDLSIVSLWNQQHGCDVLADENEELLRALLNDPDNAFLRTGPGRI